MGAIISKMGGIISSKEGDDNQDNQEHKGAIISSKGDDKNSGLLPSDVVFEILIRTDIELLPTLARVCKGWCNLISHPHFVHRHQQRSKTVHGFIFRPELKWAWPEEIFFVPHPSSPLPEALPDLDFLPEPVKIVASSTHGLLCCVGLEYGRKYYVCKPTTKEWTLIPTPRTRYKTLKMDMVVTFKENTVWFKIVRVSKHKRKPQFTWQVFDSETWEWTELKHIQSYLGSMKLESHDMKIGLVVKGCLCWIAYKKYGSAQIMAFNVWREKLGTLQIPKQASMYYSVKLWMVNVDGNLGLILYPTDSREHSLWVMPSMENQRWEMKVEFNLIEYVSGWSTIVTLAPFVVDDILFMLTSTDSMW